MSKIPDTGTNDQTTKNSEPGSLVLKARFHRRQQGHGVAIRPGPPSEPREPVHRPARIAIRLALAHKIEQAIREGKLRNRAEAALRLGLSRARVSQICDLALLPVSVQEEVLFLQAVDGKEPAGERNFRQRSGHTHFGERDMERDTVRRVCPSVPSRWWK